LTRKPSRSPSPPSPRPPTNRGATTASGIHETYDSDHATEVAWYFEDEAAEEF
jgi:hypothetical protein